MEAWAGRTMNMRFDKLTSKLQSAFSDAQSLAVGKDHNLIQPVHLLLALLDQKGGFRTPLAVTDRIQYP